MLNFRGVKRSSNEKATDHIEMRVRPSDKERMSRAAELSGVRLATFVRAAAAREAERVLYEYRTTVLSEHDSQALLKALDDSPVPTPAARDAVRAYRSRVVNAG